MQGKWLKSTKTMSPLFNRLAGMSLESMKTITNKIKFFYFLRLLNNIDYIYNFQLLIQKPGPQSKTLCGICMLCQ